MLIHPYVFWVPELPDLDLNHEAQSIHTLSIDALLAGRGRGEMELVHRGVPLTLPRVDFDGVRLWGLTLRMVDDLLHRLDGNGTGLSRPTPRQPAP